MFSNNSIYIIKYGKNYTFSDNQGLSFNCAHLTSLSTFEKMRRLPQ